MAVNMAIILGRLGGNPELKYTPSGTAVCTFSVATSESWTDKAGTKQEKTEWHRCVVWGKLGEVCNQYLAKGRQVYLEGKLTTRSWDDKDGKKCYTTEIVASNVQFIGERGGSQGGAPAPTDNAHQMGQQSFGVDQNFTADDIPF